VQERVFTFTADLSAYGDMPISHREVLVPQSIIRAFDDRQITFELLADDVSIQIAPGALNTAQTRNLQPGLGTYYRLSLSVVQTGMPPLQTNTEFATIPQRFTVQATTPQRDINLNTFARPVGVTLDVGGHIAPEGLRTGLFVHDTNAASWRDTAGRFDFAQSTLTSNINAPTTFAGISRNAPPAGTPNHPSNAAMQNIASRFTITDMTRFDPEREVTALQFNNIVNAISNNRTSATMGASLPAAATRSLTNARLLASADFTRENALDIMVRLYGLRTRQQLTPMSTAQSIPGLQTAAPALHRNLRIAADLGFITGPLEPQGRITMGELMHMVDIIIEDAGM
jgi:hypothetical protein